MEDLTGLGILSLWYFVEMWDGVGGHVVVVSSIVAR